MNKSHIDKMSERAQSALDKRTDVGTRISVVVRVRPPNQREIGSAQGNVIHVLDDRVLIFDPPNERVPKSKFVSTSQSRAKNLHFGFDKVLSPENTQEDVFEVVKSTVFSEEGGLLDGFNCTVFAYGATGSGKTFSMAGTPENPGLMSRAVQYIYTSLEKMGRKAKLRLSYLEIYNEQIRDLLTEDSSKELKIVEDPEKGIVVTGLSHCYPTNTYEVLQLISLGNNRRTQAQTESNPVSSRSHAVCQIEVENCDDVPDIQTSHPIGKLSLIDLAGSERATSNTGIRLKESAKINCSLLALSNCINALCTQNTFIPFRQSKLTRLLKDSLGGNCKTVCLSCVSPSYMTYDDTYSTLQYANKTKNIRTNVTRNTLNVKAQVSQYPRIIAELKAKLQQYENQESNNPMIESFVKSIDEPFNKEKQSIQMIINREIQNLGGTDYKEQLASLSKISTGDLKRKILSKLSAFTTECIRRRPNPPSRQIENEQKIRMLELENLALKGQLELAEKQIFLHQNIMNIITSQKIQPKQIQQHIQTKQEVQNEPLIQMTPIELAKTRRTSAPAQDILDLIDFTSTREPKPNQVQQKPIRIEKSPKYESRRQEIEIKQNQFERKIQPYEPKPQRQEIAPKPSEIRNQMQKQEVQKQIPLKTENQEPNRTNWKQYLLSFIDDCDKTKPKQDNSSQQNSNQIIPKFQSGLSGYQPLSARRLIDNKNSSSETSQNKIVPEKLMMNGSVNININSDSNAQRFSNISINNENSISNHNNDNRNDKPALSQISRLDDPSHILRQRFAEIEKMNAERKPLSERTGNISSTFKKNNAPFLSLMDKLSQKVAANEMNSDEEPSILLRNRMLTQNGK